MIDIFETQGKFINFMFWLMPSLLVLTVIPTTIMMDLNLPVSDALAEATAICFGTGAGIFVYRVFVIAWNDLTKKEAKE